MRYKPITKCIFLLQILYLHFYIFYHRGHSYKISTYSRHSHLLQTYSLKRLTLIFSNNRGRRIWGRNNGGIGTGYWPLWIYPCILTAPQISSQAPVLHTFIITAVLKTLAKICISITSLPDYSRFLRKMTSGLFFRLHTPYTESVESTTHEHVPSCNDH